MKYFSILLLLTGCTRTVYVDRYVQVPLAPLVYPAEYYNKIYPKIDMPSCEAINAQIKADLLHPVENIPCVKDDAYRIIAGKIKAQKAVIEQCERKIANTRK